MAWYETSAPSGASNGTSVVVVAGTVVVVAWVVVVVVATGAAVVAESASSPPQAVNTNANTANAAMIRRCLKVPPSVICEDFHMLEGLTTPIAALFDRH
jgi:hypothetical protein